MLSTGTEASKDGNNERELVERFSCGDGGCKTLTISQDRQIMDLRIVQTVVLTYYRTCAASACGNWAVGFVKG